MSSKDARLLATAKRLIENNGAAIRLVIATLGGYNAATRTMAKTEISYDVFGVISKVKRYTWPDGSMVDREDREFVLPGDVVPPAVGDKILFKNITYTVAAPVTAEYSGDTIVMMSVACKKG